MNIERKRLYDKVYMKMAIVLSQLSFAEKHKVGCVIVSEDGQIISQGYNGTPSGRDNKCEYTVESTEGLRLVTKREVLHAESNAIIKCAKWHASTDGATLYTTLSPCFDCSKMIIQAGIKRVVYKEVYHDTEGLDLLNDVGIKVDKLDEE